jgi:hypothetical protein
MIGHDHPQVANMQRDPLSLRLDHTLQHRVFQEQFVLVGTDRHKVNTGLAISYPGSRIDRWR